uniref:Uncharacterized protein n=1 Tax=Glossina austeni TaxID=7395 RepID=A0A1A9VGH9_GLOAU
MNYGYVHANCVTQYLSSDRKSRRPTSISSLNDLICVQSGEPVKPASHALYGYIVGRYFEEVCMKIATSCSDHRAFFWQFIVLSITLYINTCYEFQIIDNKILTAILVNFVDELQFNFLLFFTYPYPAAKLCFERLTRKWKANKGSRGFTEKLYSTVLSKAIHLVWYVELNGIQDTPRGFYTAQHMCINFLEDKIKNETNNQAMTVITSLMNVKYLKNLF